MVAKFSGPSSVSFTLRTADSDIELSHRDWDLWGPLLLCLLLGIMLSINVRGQH